MRRVDISLRSHNLALHWVSEEWWFAACGYEVWRSKDQGISWDKCATLRHGWARSFSRYPFLAQAFRMGINNIIVLSTGTVLCIEGGTMYRSTDHGITFVPVLSGYNGRGPLRCGICQDWTGRVFFGEYWVNPKFTSVRLWRSDDDGLSWRAINTWLPRAIQHIHLVQIDPYEEKMYIGTGDDGDGCQIMYTEDGGETFQSIGGGNQIWRAVSLLFTQESILWGTDSGAGYEEEPNYLVRWNRASQTLDLLKQVCGPIYYSCQTRQGIFAFATAVERSTHDRDRHVHLYWSKDHSTWNDVRLGMKLPLPGIFGPATITFPLSDKPLERLLFNTNFVLSNNGSLFEAVFPSD